jgi:hypothetical protein
MREAIVESLSVDNKKSAPHARGQGRISGGLRKIVHVGSARAGTGAAHHPTFAKSAPQVAGDRGRDGKMLR